MSGGTVGVGGVEQHEPITWTGCVSDPERSLRGGSTGEEVGGEGAGDCRGGTPRFVDLPSSPVSSIAEAHRLRSLISNGRVEIRGAAREEVATVIDGVDIVGAV